MTTLEKLIRALRAAGYDRDLLARAASQDDLQDAAHAVAALLQAGISPDDAATLCGGVVVTHQGQPAVAVRDTYDLRDSSTRIEVPLRPDEDEEIEDYLRREAEEGADADAEELRDTLERSTTVTVECSAWIATPEGLEHVVAEATTVAHPYAPGSCGREHADHDWTHVATWGRGRDVIVRQVCAACGAICEEDHDPLRDEPVREYEAGAPDGEEADVVWRERYAARPDAEPPEWLTERARDAVLDRIAGSEPVPRDAWGLDVVDVGVAAERDRVLVTGATAYSLALAGEYEAAADALPDDDEEIADLLADLPEGVARDFRDFLVEEGILTA